MQPRPNTVSVAALRIHTKGLHHDSTDAKCLRILEAFLQSRSMMRMDTTADQIWDLLPATLSFSNKMYRFDWLCIRAAAQIPYHHPAQLKLARLLECVWWAPDLDRSDAAMRVPCPRMGQALQDSLAGTQAERPRHE